jgi:small subunit ribosomal protein S18
MKEKRPFNKKRKFTKPKSTARFKIGSDTNIDYKNLPLIQRFLNDRGKIVPRRISGVSAKEQRQLSRAIKLARFLALLPSGGVNK